MKIVIALMLAAGLATCGQPKYTCVAGPNEQCASDQWYADYQRLKKLQAPYVAPREVQEQLRGISTQLQMEIPPGYQWDEAKARFVKTAPPTQPSTLSPAPATVRP
jgi:hypothetical protein